MKVIRLVDTMLRDRKSLYEKAASGTHLGRLAAILLLIFVVTAMFYGFMMGGFRWMPGNYRSCMTPR